MCNQTLYLQGFDSQGFGAGWELVHSPSRPIGLLTSLSVVSDFIPRLLLTHWHLAPIRFCFYFCFIIVFLWSTKIDAVKVVWNISPDSTLLGVTDAWMKSHFSQSGQVFPQFWVFEAIFEARGKNFRIFKNSVCTFYCTQNDRLNPTVSMQKSVWKTDHPRPRYLWKNKIGLRFGLACHVKKHFCKYIGPGWSVFQTDFCIETVGLRRSFWVQ